MAHTPASPSDIIGVAIPTTDPTNGAGTTTQATAQQLAVGNSQWITLTVKVKDLVRVGTDPSRTLANLVAAEILLNLTAPSAATITVQANALYLEGGYGADVGDVGNPYVYRYRGRSSITGEVSNVSPPSRGGVSPRRQRVQTAAPGAIADAQCDLLDWFRFGGALDRFTYVGTGPNSTATFNDDYADTNLDGGVTPNYDDFQPWPTLDIRRAGTCTIAGPALKWVSGDTFNVNWAPGSLVMVNGRACTIERVLSTTVLHLNESAGTGSAIAFEMPGPEILGQPLPALFGPDNDNYFYACGDASNPGTLYWSKPGSPDLTSDTFTVVGTSGSEPLQHGWIRDGQAFVASSEDLYVIVDDPNRLGGKLLKRTAAGRGFWTRWAFCPTPYGIAYLAKDGIALSADGGTARLLTDPDLHYLFPHDGVAGVDVNGVEAPDMTQTTRHQLTFIDGALYYDYVSIDGHDRTLIYMFSDQAWIADVYATGGIYTRLEEPGSGVHDQILGNANGYLQLYSGVQDVADTTHAVAWQWNSHWEDYGEPRVVKQFGDVIIDADPANGTVGWTVTPVFDDATITLTPQTLAQNVNGRQQIIADLNAGDGQLARNMGIQVSGADSVTPIFYLWEPAGIAKAEDTQKRATDWDNLGYAGAKFVQGLIVRANTYGVAKTVQIQYDGGTVALTLTITHNGEVSVAYPSASAGWTPFVAHLVRVVPTDDDPWQLYELDWIYEPAPESASEWKTQSTTHDLPGYFTVRDGLIAYDSTATVTLRIAYDGGTSQSYTLASTAGVYTRQYLPFSVGKGRSVTYRLTSSAPFRLYKRDMAVRVQGWGLGGGYQTVYPFGGPSRADGASI